MGLMLTPRENVAMRCDINALELEFATAKTIFDDCFRGVAKAKKNSEHCETAASRTGCRVHQKIR
jgi:hypothetical protein